MIWAALICTFPTLLELYLDRHGESRKNKPKQLIILTVVSLALAIAINWRLTIDWYRCLALMFGVHFLVFDYAIVWILRRNGVIRADAKVWDYTGETSRIDKIVAKVNPWIRFAVRVLVFGISLAFFIS